MHSASPLERQLERLLAPRTEWGKCNVSWQVCCLANKLWTLRRTSRRTLSLAICCVKPIHYFLNIHRFVRFFPSLHETFFRHRKLPVKNSNMSTSRPGSVLVWLSRIAVPLCPRETYIYELHPVVHHKKESKKTVGVQKCNESRKRVRHQHWIVSCHMWVGLTVRGFRLLKQNILYVHWVQRRL